MKEFNRYLSALKQNLAQGDATELTHRSALQRLVEELASGVSVVNEAKRSRCGAPDFSIRRGKVPVAHIETKDIGTDLDEVEKGKGPRGPQFKRYKEGLPNWILTDYLRFDWFVGGEFRKTARFAELEPDGKLRLVPGGVEAVQHLLAALVEPVIHTVVTARELAKRMASITHLLREAIDESFKTGSDPVIAWLNQWLASFRVTLLPELKAEEFADMFAQTLAYGLFAARIQSSKAKQSFSHAEALLAVPKSNPFLRKLFSEMAGADMPDEFRWAVDELVRLMEFSAVETILADFGREKGHNDPIFHFYETFLTAYDPKLKEKRGVYYTPEPVVRYIVRSVDSLLKSHFSKPRGLADERTLILDPATGTATFLYYVIKHVHESMAGQKGAWPGYVRDHLLRRIFGFELLMAPYAIAHLKLGLEFEDTGYKFSEGERLGIYLTNTLEDAVKKSEMLVAKTISDEANTAVDIKREREILVVLGNPPYKGISANSNERERVVEAGGYYTSYRRGARREQSTRIQKIARKRQAIKELTFIGELMDTYKWIDNTGIKEQKSWLNNDYVKFIRFSQWRLEKTGEGILGFITDSSYLDKSSFRAMRWNLMQCFNELYILNLHGRTRPPEDVPQGMYNGNVFDIQQGVAILLAVRQPNHKGAGIVRYADLWGTREDKYGFLDAGDYSRVKWETLSPCAPLYLFERSALRNTVTNPNRVEQLESHWAEYFPLNEIFRVTSSGFTTARDYFVMSTSKKDLENRMKTFGDPNVTDEEIRQSYFSGKGSDKYPDGDSRGWKLANARAKFRADKMRRDRIRKVLYRPFNEWYVFWADYMVDWPRQEVMQNLEQPNIALIYSRNVEIPRAEHFLCTDRIAGHHSVSLKEVNYLAPLFVGGGSSSDNHELFNSRVPNLNRRFLDALSSHLGVSQEPEFGLPQGVSPEDIFHYIYAVVHAQGYRSLYLEFLRKDFPRVPLTRDMEKFRELGLKGRSLIALHLLNVVDAPGLDIPLTRFEIAGTNEVSRVKYSAESGRVWINDEQYFSGVPNAAWDFTIGGYRVCERWLKDRKGQALEYDDLQHWQRIVVALTETQRLMGEIDALIPEWPLK
jgi:predicted helicase